MIPQLVAAIAVGFAGYEGYLWLRKKNSFTPLQSGCNYIVLLDYAGAGAGGGLTDADVQGWLDAGGAGHGTLTVNGVNVDPTKKTIVYGITANANVSGTEAVLAPSTFSAAYGKLSVAMVQDIGTGASASLAAL